MAIPVSNDPLVPKTEAYLSCPNAEWGALADELLRQGHLVRLHARGQSMHPAIRDGEVLHVLPAVATAVRCGQVVLYLSSGSPLIHRVVRKRHRNGSIQLFIGSDCSAAGGEWVFARQVLGRVVAIERGDRCISLDGWRGRLRGWAFLALRPWRPLIRRLRRFRLRDRQA